MRQASSNLKTSWQGHWICHCLVSCWDGQNATVVNLQINLVIFSLLLSIHWSTFSSFPSVLWEDKGWGSRNTNCSSEVLINKICLVKFSPPAALKLKRLNPKIGKPCNWLDMERWGVLNSEFSRLAESGRWGVLNSEACSEGRKPHWGNGFSQVRFPHRHTEHWNRHTDTQTHRLTDTETQL